MITVSKSVSCQGWTGKKREKFNRLGFLSFKHAIFFFKKKKKCQQQIHPPYYMIFLATLLKELKHLVGKINLLFYIVKHILINIKTFEEVTKVSFMLRCSTRFQSLWNIICLHNSYTFSNSKYTIDSQVPIGKARRQFSDSIYPLYTKSKH